MQPPPRRDRDARPDRVPRQLVPEADVPRLDLEQLPALRLLRRLGPAPASRRPAPTCATRLGTTETSSHQPARVRRRGATRARARRSRPTAAGRPTAREREQLGDVERVAAGRGVHLVRRRRRRARRPRPPTAARARGTPSPRRGSRPPRRAADDRRRLAAAEGQHEQRRQRADPPPEHGDRVERRVVGPVHVLEHEHGRPRRQLELGDQQALDLVRARRRRRAPARAAARRSRRGRGSGRAAAGSRGRRRCRRAPAPRARDPARTG